MVTKTSPEEGKRRGEFIIKMVLERRMVWQRESFY
jgi:hypothetical protein